MRSALEVPDALDAAVILACVKAELDAYPVTRRKGRLADETNCAGAAVGQAHDLADHESWRVLFSFSRSIMYVSGRWGLRLLGVRCRLARFED